MSETLSVGAASVGPAPRRGLLARIRSLFRRRRASAPEAFPPVRDEEAHGYQTIELRTPAQGDGFEFTVVAHCDWCAIGVPAEVVGEYRRLVPRLVQDAVRPLARQYPPHQPDLAEQAINSRLREGWCFDGGAVKCEVRAQVALDERLLEGRRAFLLQRMDVDAGHELAVHRLGLLRELLRLWLEALAEMADNRLAPSAGRLTMRPEELAETLRDLAHERREDAERLLRTVERVIGARPNQQLGPYEASQLWDVAFRSWAAYAEGPVPRAVPDPSMAVPAGPRPQG